MVKYNLDIVPLNKPRARMKRPYLKCTCGKKNYFDGLIKPDKRFAIFITNRRDTKEDKFQLVCPHCDKVITIGLDLGPTPRMDN